MANTGRFPRAVADDHDTPQEQPPALLERRDASVPRIDLHQHQHVEGGNATATSGPPPPPHAPVPWKAIALTLGSLLGGGGAIDVGVRLHALEEQEAARNVRDAHIDDQIGKINEHLAHLDKTPAAFDVPAAVTAPSPPQRRRDR